jgi:hypothetical protein
MLILFQFPTTEDKRICTGQQFERKWNFPNCLGAVNGKHMNITPPQGNGSYFWNYKSFNSLVLMAIANANYEFIYCDIGTNGRVSDGGVIENTTFYNKLLNGNLRPDAHQGNWQPQRNRDFQEKSWISSRQLVSRLAGSH